MYPKRGELCTVVGSLCKVIYVALCRFAKRRVVNSAMQTAGLGTWLVVRSQGWYQSTSHCAVDRDLIQDES